MPRRERATGASDASLEAAVRLTARLDVAEDPSVRDRAAAELARLVADSWRLDAGLGRDLVAHAQAVRRLLREAHPQGGGARLGG